MRRINLTNVPEEIFAELVRDGESRRETVAATVLRIVCDRYMLAQTSQGVVTASRSTSSRHKFIPPTIEELKALIDAKGYHVKAEEFLAFYQSNGWKVGRNPMKDWKQAMVTWESRWKENHKPVEKPGAGFVDALAIKREQVARARARGEID